MQACLEEIGDICFRDLLGILIAERDRSSYEQKGFGKGWREIS